MRGIIRISVSLLVALHVCSCSTQPPYSPKQPILLSAEDKKRVDEVERILGLSYPYELKELAGWSDGGSNGVEMEGANKKRVAFCWEHCKAGDDEMPPGPSRFFFGSTEWGKGRRMKIGCEEEKATIDMLRLFANRYVAPESQSKLVKIYEDDDLRMRVSSYHDSPAWKRFWKVGLVRDYDHLTREQWSALKLIWIAHLLEGQASRAGETTRTPELKR